MSDRALPGDERGFLFPQTGTNHALPNLLADLMFSSAPPTTMAEAKAALPQDLIWCDKGLRLSYVVLHRDQATGEEAGIVIMQGDGTTPVTPLVFSHNDGDDYGEYNIVMLGRCDNNLSGGGALERGYYAFMSSPDQVRAPCVASDGFCMLYYHWPRGKRIMVS